MKYAILSFFVIPCVAWASWSTTNLVSSDLSSVWNFRQSDGKYVASVAVNNHKDLSLGFYCSKSDKTARLFMHDILSSSYKANANDRFQEVGLLNAEKWDAIFALSERSYVFSNYSGLYVGSPISSGQDFILGEMAATLEVSPRNALFLDLLNNKSAYLHLEFPVCLAQDCNVVGDWSKLSASGLMVSLKGSGDALNKLSKYCDVF